MSLILVVEQEGRYIERIHDALSSEGWQVRVANDRDSAQRAVAQERPALVLVSSEINGARELLQRFSRKGGGPGSLVLVNEGAAQGTLTPANFGADDLIAKPFTDSDLRLLVRRTLNAAQRQAAEAHAASTKRFTSQELFSDLVAEVESAPVQPVKAVSVVDKKLEETLSGLLDKPAARAPKPAAAARDVDSLLSKSLSGLELPKAKPAATAAAAPAKPAVAPPPKGEEPKAPPPPPRVELVKVEAPRPAPPKVEPPRIEPPKVEPPKVEPPGVEPMTPAAARPASAERPSKVRPPEERLKQVAESAAEKPRTGTGEFKRKDLDFSKLDELVKPAARTPTKSGVSRAGSADAFRTQRIETVKPAPPERPREFGQYTLMRRIATGGMAEVWQARMKGVEGFQKTVAIKKILPSLTDSVDFVTMFIDEAKLAAQLQHNGIIHIYDLGKIADDYYIAMEYVEGKDLRSILNQARAQHRAIPQGLALMVAARLAAALDYAHRKKDFEGRDVSPQNVLIGYEGDIKLCDFGIVKAVSKSSKTQMGALKGKLQYMSPEQAWGKPVDARSDIFSLGALLFEMLTGRRLFAGDSEISILDAVREGKMDRPRSLDPSIPREVDELVMRALARDPDDRFETAGQMQRELEKVLSTLRLQPTQADLAAYMHELFGAEARAEPKTAAAAAPAPVQAPEALPSVAAAISAPRFGREVTAIPPREGTRADAAEGKGRGLLIAAIVAAALIGAGLYYVFSRSRAAAPPSAPETVAPAPETPPVPGPEAAPVNPEGAAPESAAPPPVSTVTPPPVAPPPALASAAPPATKAAAPAKPTPAPPPVTTAAKPAATPVVPAAVPPAPAAPESAPLATQAPPETIEAPAPEPVAPEPEPVAPAAPAPPSVQMGDLVGPGAGVVPPSLVNRPAPSYPQMAKMQRIEGVVSIEVLVDENGSVAEARYSKRVAQNVGLNEAAMAAAKQARFRSATKHGVRVKMWYTLTFPFKL